MNPVKRLARYWSKVKPVPSGCWEWQGPLHKTGYAYLKWNGKISRINRHAYEMHKGLIPDGLHVMHSCDNRCCVNPDHLSVGTHRENMQDMGRKGRNYHKRAASHCKYGHALTSDNRTKQTGRCLVCQRFANRAAYLRAHPNQRVLRSRTNIGEREVLASARQT